MSTAPMNGTPDVPEGLQPRPAPFGWTTQVATFRRPGETLIMGQTTYHHPLGSFVGFLSSGDLGRLIKDLQGLKRAVEQEESRSKGPSGIQMPEAPKLIIPGQD